MKQIDLKPFAIGVLLTPIRTNPKNLHRSTDCR
ncbi:uncharacterized protein METZ01_LOCUS322301 [marine metagenome]|uniref:Uncharacterized protein n=1 Tax=marine metagenome TaxID=408172 RepID=A0A382P9E6_9ZZZZ